MPTVHLIDFLEGEIQAMIEGRTMRRRFGIFTTSAVGWHAESDRQSLRECALHSCIDCVFRREADGEC